MSGAGAAARLELQPGDRLWGELSRCECVVEAFVARGGGADVYSVKLEGGSALLKWYSDAKSAPAGERERIVAMSSGAAPGTAVLWPIDMVKGGAGAWGYLVLRTPKRFGRASDLMTLQVPTTFRALFKAAFTLSTAFRELHSKGYCCYGIDQGIAKIDPSTGDALLYACDNLAICGKQTGGEEIGVFHPLFAPPESWKEGVKPNWNTDIWGLAVFLFWLLVHHHPLLGRQELEFRDVNEGIMYCVSHPLFIFHPDDPRNLPHPQLQKTALIFWPRLPLWVRRLFTKTFTEGVSDPAQRPMESQWQNETLRAYDSIIVCAKCRHENFYDWTVARDAGGKLTCINCEQPLELPPRMRLDGQNDQIVVLGRDVALYPHHTSGPGRRYDLSTPTGRVMSDSTGTRTGVQNLSSEKWVAILSDASCHDVAPQETVELAHGMTLNFGHAKGEIRI